MTVHNKKSRIRVLICDDSLLFRSVIADLLENNPEFEVVGEAVNGKEAIEQVLLLKPDIVTMDLEMPIMGGHEAIQHIMAVSAVPILVVSSLDDAKNAYMAISNGALDVIGKPQLELLEIEEFIRKIKMLSQIKVIKHINRSVTARSTQVEKLKKTVQREIKQEGKSIFAIASSTGGPQALETILKGLPADFPSPIVISQHISKGFSQGLAQWLNNCVSLRVKIAEDSEQLMPGHVYISPSQCNLSIDINHCAVLNTASDNEIYHPSCDVLLKSVAYSYAKKAVGIICTGMGKDGAVGIESIHAQGGVTLAQDEKSSVIFGMNKVAISRNCINHILPLDSIAGKMLSLSAYKPS